MEGLDSKKCPRINVNLAAFELSMYMLGYEKTEKVGLWEPNHDVKWQKDNMIIHLNFSVNITIKRIDIYYSTDFHVGSTCHLYSEAIEELTNVEQTSFAKKYGQGED